MYGNMKILISGGAGYIGSHVAIEFIKNKCAVTIIDNFKNGKKYLVPKKANLLISDISDKKKITNLFKSEKFDIAVHLAAYTKVGESVIFPKKYYENNFKKAKKFFQICYQNGVKNFIFSSTGSVYGNVNKKNINEKQKTFPINPYSKSKLRTENFLKKINFKNKIKIITLRYFNVAGADKDLKSGQVTNPDNLIQAICEYIVGKRKKFTINGDDYDTKDGTAIRDYIHVSDLAKIHYIVSKKIVNLRKNYFYDVFNCGYGRGHSVLDIVKQAEKIIKKKIKFNIGPRRQGDLATSVANVDKFKKKFNWKPKFNNLNTIIGSALKWEKKLKSKKN